MTDEKGFKSWLYSDSSAKRSLAIVAHFYYGIFLITIPLVLLFFCYVTITG